MEIRNKPIHLSLFVLIIILIFMAKGIVYAGYITPPTIGSAPDDVGHFSYIQYLVVEKNLPILGKTGLETVAQQLRMAYWDGDAVDLSNIRVKEDFNIENGENWIAQHPPLYYLLMAPVYSFARLFTDRFVPLLLTLRLVTLLLGACTIIAIDKTLVCLKCNRNVSRCILLAFIFSPSMQFCFSNITNDSLLILLCVTGLLFLLKYLEEKRRVYYYLFVIDCAMVAMTKYTGALILIGYILFFLYKSCREDGLKTTLQLCVRGGVIGAIIIMPVFIRNFTLYGNMLQVYDDMTPKYYMSVMQFLFGKGYLNQIYLHINALIGWRTLVEATPLMTISTAWIICISACLYAENYLKKRFRITLLALGIAFALIGYQGLELNFSTVIALAGILVLLITIFIGQYNNLKEKEINWFIAIALIVVVLIFGKQHYDICCVRGYPGAMHGRYYFIAWLPTLYLIFNSLRFVPTKISRWVPPIFAAVLILQEYQVIQQCMLLW